MEVTWSERSLLTHFRGLPVPRDASPSTGVDIPGVTPMLSYTSSDKGLRSSLHGTKLMQGTDGAGPQIWKHLVDTQALGDGDIAILAAWSTRWARGQCASLQCSRNRHSCVP